MWFSLEIKNKILELADSLIEKTREIKIIDTHWHICLPKSDMLNVMNIFNIEKVFVIPLDFRGYSWDQVISFVGMKSKPKEYIENVLTKTIFINNDAQLNGEPTLDDRFEFIPFISVCSPELSFEEDNPYRNNLIVKIIPPFDDVTNDYWKKVIEIVERFSKRTIFMIHTGWGCKPKHLKELIETYPDRKFIMAHMRDELDSDKYDRIMIMKSSSNVYSETSYCEHPLRIEEFVEKGFEDRLLFGSDFRVEKHISLIKHFSNCVSYARITDGQKKKIFYDNAAELIKGLST